MPVSNIKPTSVSVKKECCTDGGCGCQKSGCGSHQSCCGGHFGKKLIKVLFGIALVYLIIFLGTLIQNFQKKFYYIGKADKMERSIMVAGYGKINGSNDIAVTSIGFSNTDKDVAKAQSDNKKVMDQVLSELKKLGVAEKDLQTDYSVYPDYNYTQAKGQELTGYRVSNSISIKIRDLSKIPSILNLSGKYGATEVGGLSFTIDDPENLKGQAREKALVDAKQKALILAQKLGVHLGGVVSYYESEGSNDYYPMKSMLAEGGGATPYAPEAVASGSKDVVMNVSVTYEILQ